MSASGFCPQCGNQRTGELRYCAKCGFDFWKAAQADAPAPTATPQAVGPSETERRRRPWLLWAGAVLGGLILVGAIASALGGNDGVGQAGTSISASPSPTDLPTATEEPFSFPTPEPPPSGPLQASVGEWVDITCGDEECMRIRVSKPSFHDYYPGEYGFNDEPEESGWQYLQVYVTYESLKNAADYGLFDWAIYAGNRQLDSATFTVYGPQRTLESGDLPKGRTAEGWLIYEVPPNRRITLSYEPNFEGPPVFEVVLRR
jgi:hypothetical protein